MYVAMPLLVHYISVYFVHIALNSAPTYLSTHCTEGGKPSKRSHQVGLMSAGSG